MFIMMNSSCILPGAKNIYLMKPWTNQEMKTSPIKYTRERSS